MPVTVNTVDHAATGWRRSKVSSSDELLKKACSDQYQRCERIVQCSFSRSSLREHHTSASRNGLVWSAYHAYSSHHHLVIRPEDVWFAILTQTSFYINAHAEDLRAFFVAHEGQKHLEVVSAVADFGLIAQEMTDLIAKNVVDPSLRDWVMPSFSTTTDCDKIVGAVLFMGAMQKYFSYGATVDCGIPSVRLLGEVEDWQEMLGRIDKLELLGEEPTIFAKMLRPILSHMVLSFEDPMSDKVVHFWNTIMHEQSLLSGTSYLTGWLTAFCFWDEKGQLNHLEASWRSLPDNTHFGDVRYPRIDLDDVPAGFASVPVQVNDNGDEYKATMVAGSVGIVARPAHSLAPPSSSTAEASTNSAPNASTDLITSVSSQGEDMPIDNLEQTGTETNIKVLDTVQPLSGWWIFENTENEEGQNSVGASLEISDHFSRYVDDTSGEDLALEETYQNFVNSQISVSA